MPSDRGQRAISEQIAYYRARAPEYDQTFRGAHDPELVAALEAAEPRGRVLELACGTGAWTRSLVRQPVESILAVDSAPEMLTIHAANLPDTRITRVSADLFEWTPPGEFDFITFAFWLSHVPPARFDAFWERLRGSLAAGGRVFFVDQDERAGGWEQPSDDPDIPTVERRLLDGRTMTAIKIYHRPSAVAAELSRLGWHARVEPIGGEFLVGEARPAQREARDPVSTASQRRGVSGGR